MLKDFFCKIGDISVCDFLISIKGNKELTFEYTHYLLDTVQGSLHTVL